MNGTDIDVFFACPGAKTINMRTCSSNLMTIRYGRGVTPKAVAQIVTERQETIDYLNEVAAATDVKAALVKDPGPTRRADGTKSITRSQAWWMLKQEADPVAAISDRLGHAA